MKIKSVFRLLTLGFSFFLVSELMAQEEAAPDITPKQDKGTFFTGGSLGAQFGTSTFVDISPQLGYLVTKKFAVGIGITYQYLHYKDYNYSMETNIYGGRAFARYYLFPRIFAHAEYEILNLEKFDWNGTSKNARVNVESFLVGGGYREAVGENIFLNILVLYNLTESPYSPVSNPVFRMGIDIGI